MINEVGQFFSLNIYFFQKKYYKKQKSTFFCSLCTDFQVYQQLVEKTKSTPGARVENNKFCVSVHFRCVDEKVHTWVINCCQENF